MIIESTSNPLVKKIKRLKEKKFRKETGLYIVEGKKLCLEFINFMPDSVENIIVTEDNTNLINGNFNISVVSDRVFKAVCETESPQGIMIIAKMLLSEIDFKNMKLIVYLDNVQDPGNAGTIIRTADAFGADAVILSPDCVDIYNPKTVRSTMGSLFHIPVVYESEYLVKIKELKDFGFSVIAGVLDGKCVPSELDFEKKNVICLGNEAHGISNELCMMATDEVKIPMPGKAESLNVAVAGAVLLYEAVRKGNKSNG